jgi:hypothetical protein
MGPAQVTAGAALVLAAVVCVGVWVAGARRRRNRRRREEVERGADDAAMRAEVVARLERAAAQWDHTADTAGTVGPAVSADTIGTSAASGAATTADPPGSTAIRPVELNGGPQERAEPPESRPASRPEYAPAAAEAARHGRPGRRIRVRWHPRA